MKMDLRSDLADLARAELIQNGYRPKASDSQEDIVRNLLTVRARIPPLLHWHVVESKELRKHRRTLSPNLRRGLDNLVKAARSGAALRPWLSKTVLNASFQDAALHTWRLTHFHLGETVQGDGFVERTDDWLLAVVDADAGKIYLLEVVPHDSTELAKQDLLALIERNWPGLLEGKDLKGIEVLGNYADEDIAAFRKIGVNVLTETPGGKAILGLGSGVTTAGTSAGVQMQMDQIMKHLRDIEAQLHKKGKEVEKIVGLPAGEPGDGLELRLVEYGPRLRIEEARTGRVVVDAELD